MQTTQDAPLCVPLSGSMPGNPRHLKQTHQIWPCLVHAPLCVQSALCSGWEPCIDICAALEPQHLLTGALMLLHD